MNTFAKSLTAAAVAITLTATALAPQAEAKIRGKDVAIGLALGITALAIGARIHVDSGPRRRPVVRHRRGPRGCHWMKRKARRTGSPYWWDRYERCMGY